MKTAATATLTAALVAAGPALGQTTFGGSYGYEDGAGTIVGQFPADLATAANVTGGSEVDYGPSAAPFATPVTYTVAPFAGSRLLEVTELDTTQGTPNVVLAYIENLVDGDTFSFGFRGYDPSDARSPSISPNAVYTTVDGPNSFAGYATPFQNFDDFPGTGFINYQADAIPGDGSPDPDLPFEAAGVDANRTGVALRAAFFAPTLAQSNDDGAYKFFIDDVTVSVTSSSPNARIVFADGSFVAVPEPTTAAVVGLGALALVRRRGRA